jgi:hypothetical protein
VALLLQALWLLWRYCFVLSVNAISHTNTMVRPAAAKEHGLIASSTDSHQAAVAPQVPP